MVVPAGRLAAQTRPNVPRELSLAQALDLARANSPTYRTAENGLAPAAAATRQAQFALLPTANASGGLSYTGAGSTAFAGQTFNQSSPSETSNYTLSATWLLSRAAFVAPSIARAQQHAADDNVRAAALNLVSDVTAQYLTVLRDAELVGVADEQVTRNQQQLSLAQAKFQVGQGTQLDVTQAQVTVTSAQVTVLQARQSETLAKIELLRRMGVASPAGVDSLHLTETFPLVQPNYDLEALQAMAHQSNPVLQQLADAEEAAVLGVRQARYSYWPSLQLSTGFTGFTQQFTNENIFLAPALSQAQGTAANCLFQNEILERLNPPLTSGIIADCNAYSGLNSTGTALNPTEVAAIKKGNEVFPFNFSNQPWSIQLGISVPVWDGFQRALRVSQAHQQADNAQESQRAQLLLTDATIQQEVVSVQTAWRTTQIDDSNRVAARLQLQFAQDRYRIGNGTALDVVDAQNQVTQAEATYVESIYDYHLAVVALEAAVGRPLR